MAIDISNLKSEHAEAVAVGDKLYLGPECTKPGHGCVRYVNSRACRECGREKCEKHRLRDQSSRTDPDRFSRRVFVLGNPRRVISGGSLND
ncbi:hypothetical protein EZJ58_5141 [Sodalis ligni]|uniref:Uncharacterized protein n=1 Tax=Sodalis ligni TaxID=2697027 RepID=A0A4R1NGL5_9GAMM|nr:hypothetical protein EZJ58_5141 [Sodalis ligni]